ncbi:MAG: hypothetical protein ABSH41_11060 [Syntrophobacteraceae bacterium]|jgi:hypothetical protein
MRDYEKRISALEGLLVPEQLTLMMADGTERRIEGGHYLLDMLCATIRDFNSQPVPDAQLCEFNLIKQSVSSDEGGHMVNLIKVLMAGPVTVKGK